MFRPHYSSSCMFQENDVESMIEVLRINSLYPQLHQIVSSHRPRQSSLSWLRYCHLRWNHMYMHIIDISTSRSIRNLHKISIRTIQLSISLLKQRHPELSLLNWVGEAQPVLGIVCLLDREAVIDNDIYPVSVLPKPVKDIDEQMAILVSFI